MKEVIHVVRASPPHKWSAVFPDGKKVNFGLRGYSDYTIHKDHNRMLRYLTRHVKRENWSPSGRFKAGFWSRWLLWSKPTLNGAARQTERVLGGKYRIVISSARVRRISVRRAKE
jgi:hypothetical protein